MELYFHSPIWLCRVHTISHLRQLKAYEIGYKLCLDWYFILISFFKTAGSVVISMSRRSREAGNRVCSKYVTSVHYRVHSSPTGTYPEPVHNLRLRLKGGRRWGPSCLLRAVLYLLGPLGLVSLLAIGSAFVIHATCSAHPILTVIISGAVLIMKLLLNFMSLFLLDKHLLYITYR